MHFLQCGRAQTTQPSDHPQKRCVSSQYSQLLCKTPKGKPQLYSFTYGLFYPDLGQRSSTIKCTQGYIQENLPHQVQGYIQENPPHQVQARAFNIGVNSLPMWAYSSEVKVTVIFSLEMSTCSPRIQQLRLKGSFHFFQQPEQVLMQSTDLKSHLDIPQIHLPLHTAVVPGDSATQL